LAAVCLAVLTASPALAGKICKVKEFRLNNSTNSTHQVTLVRSTPGNASQTDSNALTDDFRAGDTRKVEPPAEWEGSEIWAVWNYGKKKYDCRKDDTKLVYDPNGMTWKYRLRPNGPNSPRCIFGDNNTKDCDKTN